MKDILKNQTIFTKISKKTDQLRIMLVIGFFFAAYFLLISRAIIIHLYPPSKENLKGIGNKQYSEHISLAPYRGTIFDRRGEPLAISIKTPSLAVNPRIFKPDRFELQKLSSFLHLPQAYFGETKEKKTYFSWLKRKVPHYVAKSILEMQIKGLYEVREPARFYPAGTAAANFIGYVGTDNFGLLGLERQFESDLKGRSIEISPPKDARGKLLYLGTTDISPEKTGNNIYLTIDKVIQEITEEALARGVKKARAKGGFAIVSDPNTGKILAVANYPQFNPNDKKNLKIQDTKNKAFMDIFEPGSIIKPIIVSKAIDSGTVTAQERFFCENGVMKIGKRRIRDTHPEGELTTEETIVKSSNICTYKISEKYGTKNVYDALKTFGYSAGKSTTGFPGEESGWITPWQKWIPIRFANIAFGQGFTVSGVEMVQAFGAIANGGRLIRPYFVDRIVSSEGVIVKISSSEILRQVISPETSLIMKKILQKVVSKEGTGNNAATSLYTVAGKTGTAQKADPIKRGYSEEKRVASFIGFAPALDPYVLVFVVVDEPGKKPYFGNTWAAPIFSEVIDKTLKYLNVAPDKITPEPEKMISGKERDERNQKGI